MEDSNQISSYLAFHLEKESFCVNVVRVLEILELPEITKVPKSPDYMRGVMNLRGVVLPVVDAHTKFGLNTADDTIDTVVIVLEVYIDEEKVKLGLVVDSVKEVIEVAKSELLDAPTIGNRFKTKFLDGVVKRNDEFTMILNIDKVFNKEDVAVLKENATDSSPELIEE